MKSPGGLCSLPSLAMLYFPDKNDLRDPA